MKRLLGNRSPRRGRAVTTLVAISALVVIIAVIWGAIALAAAEPEQLSTESSVTTASSTLEPVETTTTTVTKAQANQATDEYPDPTPLPEEFASERADQLAAVALHAVGRDELMILKTYELRLPDTTVYKVVLGARDADREGIVRITIFKDASPVSPSSPDSLEDRVSTPGLSVESILVPGTAEAYLVTRDTRCQLVARMEDRTVVNVSSEVYRSRKAPIPIDRTAVELLVSALVEHIR